MLKTAAVILLLFGFFGETFSNWFIVIDYQINKDYIAKNLCENRDRPQLKCEGRCYLCKRLHKEAQKDKENPGRRSEFRLELVPFQLSYHLSAPPPVDLVSPKYPPLREATCNAFASSFFHPPDRRA